MLGYKPISSAFRKTDAKIKALIRSAFLPHERGQEDPTEETEASAPAEPRWSPDQIETPVAAAIAVAVVAQDPIQATVDFEPARTRLRCRMTSKRAMPTPRP